MRGTVALALPATGAPVAPVVLGSVLVGMTLVVRRWLLPGHRP